MAIDLGLDRVGAGQRGLLGHERGNRPQREAGDVPQGDLRIDYPLGTRGNKTVTFRDRGLRVAVQHSGAFVEQLPLLLLPSDSLSTHAGEMELARGSTRLRLRWRPATDPTVRRTDEQSGRRRVVAVAIPATDSLVYDVEVVTGPARR